jgi:23S rRNA (cytosine1962-C5)-methyltransferase
MSAKVYLKKNEERRIISGHLWVFSNEIAKTEGEPGNGDIVEVFDFRNNFIGKGFYNKNSLIAVRILKIKEREDFNSFLKDKIQSAFNLRKQFYPNRTSFRLVFSESDFLPGLIIDKYNNTFVLQVYSAGMEMNIQIIADVLRKELEAENIFSKNESYFRRLEGLTEEDKIYLGSLNEEIISDGVLKYKIDFMTGQKTGFYFDQNDNRFFIEKISNGKKVLDAFCNTGGFGIHASYAGAGSVTFVDSSKSAIKSAEGNFHLNNLKSRSEFIVEDVFDFLNKCRENNRSFDLINLDPPAFAKSKKSLPTTIKGYEKLNRLALQIINDGGFLTTSSCSHHLDETDFIGTINQAAVKNRRRVQLIHFSGASLDHPELPAMPETSYLKFAVFKVHNY